MNATATAWVAVEGPCCAGKTTLVHGLVTHFGPSVTTILPDYADFVGGGARMPDPDPASWEQECLALKILLGVEQDRVRVHLPIPSPRLVLLDRSVLTLVGHCAGLDQRDPDRPPFTERAAALLEGDPRPCWPQAVLYLDVAHRLQVARNATGKFAADSIYLDPAYNEGFREHFARMLAREDRPMAWIAGDATPDDVLQQALSFLSARVGIQSPSA
jgi:thymidylate kinase